MIREHLIDRELAHEPTFRWRGKDVSRLESLADAVFGFAIALLVVTLEVPKTYGELMQAMRGFVPFALCFATLVQIWYAHYRFFRRYGLEDAVTHILNAALLFLTLVYVYPLKFVFSAMFANFVWPTRGAASGAAYVVTYDQASHLIVLYGLGVVALFACFALLYLHAYRLRDALELNEIERLCTMVSVLECAIFIGVALLSIAVGAVAGPRVAGPTYFLLGPLITWVKSWEGKRQAQFKAQLQAAASPPLP